ncbi:unnamed protein product [Toxocara canis]|uniref:Str_synth domain-containing protein n=1 Tax=Toxocara canis TaxID=6265 RepID=A0A183UB17_TOXCA|nr:unnamed protein product [Toxocara canis]
MIGRDSDLRRRRKSSTESTQSQSRDGRKSRGRRGRQIPVWMQFILTILVAFGAFFAIVFFSPSDYNVFIIVRIVNIRSTCRLRQRPSLEGPLAVNDILTKAEYLLENQIQGPESLLVENDTIYTGTQDGIIVEIYKGEIRSDIRLKDGPCGSYELEPVCGRPLGIRRLNAEELVVMDAYLGIYTVNFNKGTFKQIFDPKVEVGGAPLKFLNDVDVVNEDLIIFTDSSSRWPRRDFLKILMEGIPSGRVFSLVPSSGKIEILMENLYFTNGIQLFPDKQSFLVAETTMARIKRFWISGPKKGTTEIFADNLPGLPDNIRLSTDGTFWVGMASVRHHQQLSLVDFLAKKTATRKFLLKLIPDSYWNVLYSKLRSRHAMIIELDTNGKIVSCAHDVNGAVMMDDISQVSDDGKYLYMGSFHASFIAKLPKHLMRSTI